MYVYCTNNVCSFVLIHLYNLYSDFYTVHGGGRTLLSAGEKPVWETCDYESDNTPVGWIILYILVVVHLFLGIAILCDDFFVPSLEAISEALQLSDDVAGVSDYHAQF